MPYVPPVALSGVMSWTDVETDLAAARVYLNAIPTADVGAGEVRREHIVEARTVGYPVQRMEAEHHLRGWTNFGRMVPAGPTKEVWGARAERCSIVPSACNPVDGRWYTPIGCTLFLPAPWTTRFVEIQCTGAVQVRGPAVGPGPPNPPLYPSGAGVGTKAGYLALVTYDRSTGVLTEFTAGSVDLYPSEVSGIATGQYYNDRWHVVYVGTLTGGRDYDIVLTYVRDTAPDEVTEIDLSEIQWSFAAS